MPKLTQPLVRQALRGVTGPMQTRHALYYYVLGWCDEKHTPAGVPFPERLLGYGTQYYHAGSRDYTIELAKEKGPINDYSGKFLTSSDPAEDGPALGTLEGVFPSDPFGSGKYNRRS